MTNVLFDVVDVLGDVEPGDTVLIWPPHVAEDADGRVKNTRPQTIHVGNGPVTEDVDPGPLWVQLQCDGRADTDPRLVRVPEPDELDGDAATLNDLLRRVTDYDPVLESWAKEHGDRAEAAALEAIAARNRSEAGAELSEDAAAVSVAAAIGVGESLDGKLDVSKAYIKPALGAGDNVDTLYGDTAVGLYSVRSGVQNLPLNTNGHLRVSHNGVSASTLQIFEPAHHSNNNVYRRKRVAGTWRPWELTPTGSALQSHLDGKLDKSAHWNRGYLGTTNANTLIGADVEGVYSVAASTPGTPVSLPGWVEVRYERAASRTVQVFSPSSPTEPATYRRVYTSGSWTEWRASSYQGRTLTSGSADDVVYPATYRVGNAYLTGLPETALGPLEVLPASTAQADIIQRFTTLTDPPREWKRTRVGGVWSEWVATGSSGGGTTGPGESLRAMVYEPTPTAKASMNIPLDLSHGGRYGWNTRTGKLRMTRDLGETWEEALYVPYEATEAVFPLDNGEMLLITDQRDNRVRHVYVSEGLADDPLNATWTKTLPGRAPHIKYSSGWSVSAHENIVLIAEYGPKAGGAWMDIDVVPENDAARFIFASTDYGHSWTTIFDLHEFLRDSGRSDMASQHMHGVAWDPHWNCVWATFGDNFAGIGSNGILRSDDFGASWEAVDVGSDPNGTSAEGRPQVVGILPMRDCVLFAGDQYPAGAMRVNRAGGKRREAWDVELAYQHPVGRHLCHRINHVKLPNGSEVGMFMFGAEGQASPSFLVATKDGWNWDVLWEDPEPQPAGAGGRTVIGPTITGELICAHDDRRVSGMWTELRGPIDLY